jgi:hypothetical protein
VGFEGKSTAIEMTGFTQFSIIISQIGYRSRDPKLAFLQARDFHELADISPQIRKAGSGPVVLCTGPPVYWGMKWERHYWTVDFSALQAEGSYILELPELTLESAPFKIGEDIYFQETFALTSVDQLEQRQKGKLGWQDCGSDMRAVEPNAVQLIGLLDGYEAFSARLDARLRSRLLAQIEHGATYLIACQRENGSFMSEYYLAREKTKLPLVLLATVALARTAEITNKVKYLEAARRGWEWCLTKKGYSHEEVLDEIEETRKIFGKYRPWKPPPSLRARDRLLFVWAAVELYRNTNDLRYKDSAVRFARNVCTRLQFLDYREYPSGIYGNFLAWEEDTAHQKSWEHVGWGYNCGSVMPEEISGLVSLLSLFPRHRDWLRWRYALVQLVRGYVKPTAALTPMGIYPLGMFDGEIRFFGPSWHGFSGMYGRIAKILMLLARLLRDPELERLAVNNLQWICGLNVGRSGENGAHTAVCLINGIGANSVEPWTGIPGSIVNGFCANPQFKLAHLDECADLPAHLSLEDWILYNGQWLSGISEVDKPCSLLVKTQYRGKAVKSELRFQADGNVHQTDSRGLFKVEALPAFCGEQIQLQWEQARIEVPLVLVSGFRNEVIVDFSDHLAIRIEVDAARNRLLAKLSNDGVDCARVRLSVRCVGVNPKKNGTRLRLRPGREATVRFGYRLEAGRVPRYANVQATSQHSWAEGELCWIQ